MAAMIEMLPVKPLLGNRRRRRLPEGEPPRMRVVSRPADGWSWFREMKSFPCSDDLRRYAEENGFLGTAMGSLDREHFERDDIEHD